MSGDMVFCSGYNNAAFGSRQGKACDCHAIRSYIFCNYSTLAVKSGTRNEWWKPVALDRLTGQANILTSSISHDSL